MRGNPAARAIAYLILFVFFVGSGFSLSAMLTNNRELGLQICIGSIVVNVIILIVGGVLVASNRPNPK